MTDQNKTVVGEIVAISGVKGYVRVKTFTTNTSDIADFDTLSDAANNIYKIVRLVSTKGSVAVVQLDGINSPDAASKLVGTELLIDNDDLPKPDEDEFYYTQLIGCKVVFEDDTPYGTIIDVVNYGASDIIEVEEPDSGKTSMYPFTDDHVKSVDLETKIVTVIKLEQI